MLIRHAAKPGITPLLLYSKTPAMNTKIPRAMLEFVAPSFRVKQRPFSHCLVYTIINHSEFLHKFALFFFSSSHMEEEKVKILETVHQYSNLEYTCCHWGSLSVFFIKVQPKKWFSINYRRAKISSESIDCSNGYDLKNWLTAGAAVVETIASCIAEFK